MGEKEITILLADDHHVVRFGLCELLNGVENFKVIADTGSGLESITLFKKSKPDIAIIDITMPDLNGIDVTREIVKLFPEAKILLLSYHISEEYLNKAIHAGASGYILKDSKKEELEDAIRKVIDGERYFSKLVSSMMVERYADNLRKPGDIENNLTKLTKREQQVLVLIAEGMTSHEIGKKLFISPRTVDTHRNNLIHKLNVKNSAALVKYAIQKGIV